MCIILIVFKKTMEVSCSNVHTSKKIIEICSVKPQRSKNSTGQRRLVIFWFIIPVLLNGSIPSPGEAFVYPILQGDSHNVGVLKEKGVLHPNTDKLCL